MKQSRALAIDEILGYFGKGERAVRELGCTATSLTTRLGISQPTVSLSVQRGERLAAEHGYRLSDLRKL